MATSLTVLTFLFKPQRAEVWCHVRPCRPRVQLRPHASVYSEKLANYQNVLQICGSRTIKPSHMTACQCRLEVRVSHILSTNLRALFATLGCGVKGRGGRIGRVTDSEDCWGALSVADGPATSLQIAHVNDDTNCCAILMGGGIAKRRSKCGGKRCECIGRWLAR